MRSLHEDDMMKSLKNRLANYSEEPDDSAWDKISAGVSNSSGSLLKPVSWAVLFVGYSALMFYAGSYFSGDRAVPPTNVITESAPASGGSSANDSTTASLSKDTKQDVPPLQLQLQHRMVAVRSL